MSNIFYAFFGTMSMISLFPMLKVLFEQTEALTTPPVWKSGLDIVGFAEDYLNFFVTTKKMEGNDDVLIFMVGLKLAMNIWHFCLQQVHWVMGVMGDLLLQITFLEVTRTLVGKWK